MTSQSLYLFYCYSRFIVTYVSIAAHIVKYSKVKVEILFDGGLQASSLREDVTVNWKLFDLTLTFLLKDLMGININPLA